MRERHADGDGHGPQRDHRHQVREEDADRGVAERQHRGQLPALRRDEAAEGEERDDGRDDADEDDGERQVDVEALQVLLEEAVGEGVVLAGDALGLERRQARAHGGLGLRRRGPAANVNRSALVSGSAKVRRSAAGGGEEHAERPLAGDERLGVGGGEQELGRAADAAHHEAPGAAVGVEHQLLADGDLVVLGQRLLDDHALGVVVDEPAAGEDLELVDGGAGALVDDDRRQRPGRGAGRARRRAARRGGRALAAAAGRCAVAGPVLARGTRSR